MQVKRKCGRPPKAKPENLNSNPKCTTAATIHTSQLCKTIKIPSNDMASRELVSKINVECEKWDRLTVAKLNTASKPYKQDYKSKLMTETIFAFANKSTAINTCTDSFTRNVIETSRF